ncbi:hypothetical protein M747DRAFT_293549 [Aspergillus niger ATCC 13496]|uniref:Uncharacterized protein n=1 Tax=Aspergillus niger ATCC 13496 TaxID=1353008 RepID=A0A370C7S7_ASPNG|nr:hypothetical protein M747DRAFT_293549 [Aspergillus niger ATCC 13496]
MTTDGGHLTESHGVRPDCGEQHIAIPDYLRCGNYPSALMVVAIPHREQSCNDKYGLRLLEDLPLVPGTAADGTVFRGG